MHLGTSGSSLSPFQRIYCGIFNLMLIFPNPAEMFWTTSSSGVLNFICHLLESISLLLWPAGDLVSVIRALPFGICAPLHYPLVFSNHSCLRSLRLLCVFCMRLVVCFSDNAGEIRLPYVQFSPSTFHTRRLQVHLCSFRKSVRIEYQGHLIKVKSHKGN